MSETHGIAIFCRADDISRRLIRSIDKALLGMLPDVVRAKVVRERRQKARAACAIRRYRQRGLRRQQTVRSTEPGSDQAHLQPTRKRAPRAAFNGASQPASDAGFRGAENLAGPSWG